MSDKVDPSLVVIFDAVEVDVAFGGLFDFAVVVLIKEG